MPSFLTRLRSLRKPKATSTSAVKSTKSKVVPQYHDEREFDVQKVPDSPDASPDSPRAHTAEVELDSKIHPDLSALFASVEDALTTVERAEEVKKRGQLSAETDSDDSMDRERRRGARERTRTNELDGSIYASYGSSMGTGGSTFEQEDTPCPPESRKTHIANPLHLHRNHHFNKTAISDNDRPSSADAVLSWSPKQIFESLDSDSLLLSPRPSSFSGSRSQALLPSPEIQERDNSAPQKSYYSPSPGTFGYPTPPNINFIQTDSPNFPPIFHSTPKTSSTRSRAGARRRSPRTRRRTVGTARTPPVRQNFQAMKRTVHDKMRSARKTASVSAFDSLESTRVPLRASSSVSRAVNRRKSAEWNSHAASAGVVADPQQATEFGWPAEVSREILRLSLGDELTFATASVPVLPAKAEPQHLKRGLPRVSHECKSTARLIRPSVSERRSPSAFLYSTILPQSSPTSSSAPGRSDRQQTTATKPPSTPHASGVAAAPAQETASQSESASGDNALDKKKLSESNMGATGAPERKRHFENDNSIDWESAELQEFISREESSKSFASGDVHALQPSTPMKKSESGSTYQTAGSSSYLQAPSLSVIAPTPRSSPGNSRHSSGASPEAAEGLHVPHPPPQSEKSKGKRKADESEEGSPPDLRGSQGKKTSFAAEVPRRDSDASHAPSSFQSFQSQKSRKRVRLSSPMATPDQSRPGSAAPPHVGSASSRGSSRSNLTPAHFQAPPDTKGSHHPRPLSRASRASRQMSTAPSGGESSMALPGRRSLSQSSIPISAIITPRAPSVSYMSSFHMRDPRRPQPQRDVGWTLRFSSADDNGSPFMAWAFWFGFLLPLLWWVASFWRIPQTRMVGTDTEKAVIVDDPFYEREARIWRLRCRVASALFFVTYVPVIVLIAVLA